MVTPADGVSSPNSAENPVEKAKQLQEPTILVQKICRLMQEFVLQDKDLRVNAHHYHSGRGGFDDKHTISSDPIYEAQDQRVKQITAAIKILGQSGRLPIEYFSDEQIKNDVNPYFFLTSSSEKVTLGMEKPRQPIPRFIPKDLDETINDLNRTLSEIRKERGEVANPNESSLDKILREMKESREKEEAAKKEKPNESKVDRIIRELREGREKAKEAAKKEKSQEIEGKTPPKKYDDTKPT